MFDQKIVVSEMLDVLLLAYKQQTSTMFLGASGVGKSATIETFANTIAPNQPNNLIDIRLCMKSIEQVGGVLMPKELPNGSFVLQTTLPEEYECLFDPKYKGVLLFDEFPSALPSIQNVAYQVTWDRVLGGRKLSDGVAVCLAGNLHTNGGKTYNILKPILNRVKAYEIDSNSEHALEDWLNTFAYHSNIHPAFIGFLEQNPSLLNTNDVDNKPNQPFMSGRSIEAASKDLYAIEQGEISERLGWISINGLLNESHAADFKKYYRIGFDLPKSTDILNGKGSVLKESHQNSSIHNYIISNVLSVWNSRFANSEYTTEELSVQLDTAFDYFKEFFVSQTGSVEDLVISAGLKTVKFVESQQDKVGRRGAKLTFINKCRAFKDVTRYYMQIQAQKNQH